MRPHPDRPARTRRPAAPIAVTVTFSVLLLGLLAAALLHPASAVRAESAEPADGDGVLRWWDSSRDVFLDGELDRSAQVLTASGRIVLLTRRFADALLLEEVEGEPGVLTVGRVEPSLLRRDPAGPKAESPAALAAEPAGRAVRAGDRGLTFALDGVRVLLARHRSPAGPLDVEALWREVPRWRGWAEGYRPDPEAVATLAAVEDEAELTVVLGTWCGDSKNHVPGLLKALEEAGNERLRVEVVAIGNDFLEPMDFIQGEGITNVPTVLVRRGGEEIGRYVESPAGETIEGDVAAILTGRPLEHRGGWTWDEELARGTYRFRRGGEPLADRESWALYRRDDESLLLHSLLRREPACECSGPEASTELWSRLGPDFRPRAYELTWTRGAERARSRGWFGDEGKLTAYVRGSWTGIQRQSLRVPEPPALSLPAVAAEGWSFVEGSAATPKVYRVPGGSASLGALSPRTVEDRGEVTVEVPAGTFPAHHFEVVTGGRREQWWIHRTLRIPVKAVLESAVPGEAEEILLETLTLNGPG